MVEHDAAAGSGAGTRKRVNGAAKGATFERRLADYFVALGYTGARRMIRTGTSKHADEGDIDGLPFTVQAKTKKGDVGDVELARWLHATAMQRLAVGHGVGLLIIKRNGHGSIGSCWVWLRLTTLVFLTGAGYRTIGDALADAEAHVRVRLDDLAPMLVRRYPPEQESK